VWSYATAIERAIEAAMKQCAFAAHGARAQYKTMHWLACSVKFDVAGTTRAEHGTLFAEWWQTMEGDRRHRLHFVDMGYLRRAWPPYPSDRKS
jgi:hypothetical protein